LPTKDNATIRAFYNSKFPLDKFETADAEIMAFRTIIKKGKYYLGYVESLKQIGGENKLIIDFDAFATDIDASDYLATTDELHDIISGEYVATIREPIYEYMKQNPLV
jgi:ribosomal protein L30E